MLCVCCVCCVFNIILITKISLKSIKIVFKKDKIENKRIFNLQINRKSRLFNNRKDIKNIYVCVCVKKAKF